MITEVSINNYKSIKALDIPLGRINVFIGENGCGKSNILEAIAFLTASKKGDLKPDGLFKRGIRVTKPSLTFNSFLNTETRGDINLALVKDDGMKIQSKLTCNNPDDIYAEWSDSIISMTKTDLEEALRAESFKDIVDRLIKDSINKKEEHKVKKKIEDDIVWKTWFNNLNLILQSHNEDVLNYLIYNINTNALRGITKDSLITPLGINGEGLDVLISSFNDDQLNTLKEYASISWLDSIFVDKTEFLKVGGFKLGRSVSNLYFTDKFMLKKNNLFSAENANEGALHILFYLALIISDKTPSFFAIDNIESCLNPKLCRDLIFNISKLSSTFNKQVIITTHNPAILDGLNLHDPDQYLYVVKRNDRGHTGVKQIKLKPSPEKQNLKLSELWMRGYLGGLPSNNF